MPHFKFVFYLGNVTPTSVSTPEGNAAMMTAAGNQQQQGNAEGATTPGQQAAFQQQQQQFNYNQQFQAMQQQQGARMIVPTSLPQPAPNTRHTPPLNPTSIQAQPGKDMNTATLCKIGQETVQEIVSRAQDLFSQLSKVILPNNTMPMQTQQSIDRKNKLQDQLKGVRLLFRRLRLVHEKCNENTVDMEYTHIQSLIPYKDEKPEMIKTEEKKQGELYRQMSEEHKELMEQVIMKNRQLKDIIDQLRQIMWEINTMLSMRRP